MAASIARWVNSGHSGIASKSVDISDIDVGETMIVVHCIGSTSITIATPDGWTPLFTKTTMGSRACAGHYRTKLDEAEVSVVFEASGTTGWAHALLGVLGALPAAWITGPVWTRAVHGTTLTNVIDGVTTLDNDSLALAISFEATTAVESPNTIAGVNNGFIELGYLGQGSAIETIWTGTKSIPTPVDVGDTTVTYRQPQASNGAGLMLAFPPGDYIPIGSSVKLGNGALARLSYMDSLGVRRAPTSLRLWKPGFNTAEQFIAKPGATMAHRGGSESFPDMSEYAYDQSVLRGFGALEFSAQRTSDGWWFGCHNADINEIAGTTGLPKISLMTRAEIEAYNNVDNPMPGWPSRQFFGLEEFLEKYGSTHMLMVDPKGNLSYNAEFMTICEGVVDPARLMWKYYLGGPGSDTPSAAALAAKNRGWGGTWGYCYSEDVDSGAFAEHSGKAGWTTLGLNIGAAQSYWDTVLAVGKPVIGHIANAQADYDDAMNKGADMVQCADVTGIMPVSI